jgi:integrase
LALDVDLYDYEAATGTLRVPDGRRSHRLVDLDESGRAALATWLNVRRRLRDPDKDGRHPLFVPIHSDGRLSPHRLTISGVSRILTRRARQAQLLASGARSTAPEPRPTATADLQRQRSPSAAIPAESTARPDTSTNPR